MSRALNGELWVPNAISSFFLKTRWGSTWNILLLSFLMWKLSSWARTISRGPFQLWRGMIQSQKLLGCFFVSFSSDLFFCEPLKARPTALPVNYLQDCSPKLVFLWFVQYISLPCSVFTISFLWWHHTLLSLLQFIFFLQSTHQMIFW